MYASLLALLITFSVITLAAILTARLCRYPGRGVLDVSEFFRAADPKKMMELLNPAFEEGLRRALPRREFRRQQRKSLHSILEFLRCMFHSTMVAIELAHNELERELVRRPGMENSDEYIQCAENLQQAAIQFRVYCFIGIVRVRGWMLFRTQWWLPIAPPRIATLSQIAGIDFLVSYGSFIQTVSELGLLHGPEFQESFLHALIKSDPLDKSLGR